MNNLQLVRRVLADLQAAGLEPLLFGGWGEEVLVLSDPRPHEDVDVVLVDPPLSVLDAFVAARDEIVNGHLRASASTARTVSRSSCSSPRWPVIRWRRFSGTGFAGVGRPVSADGLVVAPLAALRSFRHSYADFTAARDTAVGGDKP